MRNGLVIGIIGAACTSALGGDFFEAFGGGAMPCVTLDVDRGYTMQSDGDRLVGTKRWSAGSGSAGAVTDFTIAGDFDISVHARRGELGIRGVLGVLVLYDDGHFVTLYLRGSSEIAAFNSYNGHQWLWLDDPQQGELRIKKAGTALTFELDRGKGWEVIGNERVADTERPARVHLFLTSYLEEYMNFSGSFDNWSIKAEKVADDACACPADFNADGVVDAFDLLAFQTAYQRGDLKADFAEPWGVLDIFDFLAYQTIFSHGCK